MSTAITSTHQQDRVAQQKMLNGRQQTAGQTQNAAFSQMLSLACDEDTDLDALQLAGALSGLRSGEAGDEADTPLRRSRSSARATALVGDTATGSGADTLHPAAQANAQLLALLALAQAPATPATPSTLAAPANSATEVPTEVVAPLLPDSTTPTLSPVTTGGTTEGVALVPDALPTAEIAPEERPAPGKAVRSLARQLGDVLRHNAGGGADATSTTPAAPSARHALAEAGGAALNGTPLAAAAGLAMSAAAHASAPIAAAGTAPLQHEREADADSVETVLLTERTDTPTARPAGSDGQPSTGLGGDAMGGTTPGEATPGSEPTQTAAEQWREQWTEAMEQMGQQISYWVGQGGVRQATLRVGQGWQQAMDVKLAMKNGQAEVSFLTDHEAARSAIEQGGADVLRAMLAESGITLGEVSVGAQGSGGGNGQSEAQPAPDMLPRQPGQTTDLTPSVTTLQPRHAHSTGLDLYV